MVRDFNELVASNSINVNGSTNTNTQNYVMENSTTDSERTDDEIQQILAEAIERENWFWYFI